MKEEDTNTDETIFAHGKIFELVHRKQTDGRVFEIARRAPGVRLIIADKVNRKVMLTKEYRQELGIWDYRLPGGKVFDTLNEYEVFRASGTDILTPATQKVKDEAIEEAGMLIEEVRLVTTSTLGATVEWDLLVFEATEWQRNETGQSLENGEQIETEHWFSFDDVKRMIIVGEMQEQRIALILLQWLYNASQ